MAAGVLLSMVNAWWSLRAGAPAPADPWDGRTLEWRTSSPPPPHDFGTIPPVSGRDTFWRAKYGRRREGSGRRRAGRTEKHTAELHSQAKLLCRLLLEKKKNTATKTTTD